MLAYYELKKKKGGVRDREKKRGEEKYYIYLSTQRINNIYLFTLAFRQ